MGLVPRGNSQGLKLIIFNGSAHAEEVVCQPQLNGKRQHFTRSGAGTHRHARNMVIKANLAGAVHSQRCVESTHPADRSQHLAQNHEPAQQEQLPNARETTCV